MERKEIRRLFNKRLRNELPVWVIELYVDVAYSLRNDLAKNFVTITVSDRGELCLLFKSEENPIVRYVAAFITDERWSVNVTDTDTIHKETRTRRSIDLKHSNKKRALRTQMSKALTKLYVDWKL